MTQSTRLYRVMSLLTIPVVAIAIVLMADLVLHPLEPNLYGQPFWFRWLYGFGFALVNMLIGVLCMRRAPGNIIGALLVIYGAGVTTESIRITFNELLASYIFFVGATFGWIGFFILVLLFPDGKPYPRWMRWVLLSLLLSFVGYTLVYFVGAPQFTIGSDDAPIRLITNPLFIPTVEPIYNMYHGLVNALMLPLVVLSLPVSVYLRYRSGTSQEKAQIRWILWGILATMLMVIVQTIVRALGMNTLANALGNFGFILVYTLPPFAVGNAILRHKLYDIDIIIRKTLIFSLLTGILAVIYFGGVVIAQQVLRAATGETTDLAIVASTLLIAALFRPLRRRIQDTIDRRFYRRKYDAEQTLADFNQKLRDEVDIETLEGQLIDVVQDTMQPTKIALWVKD